MAAALSFIPLVERLSSRVIRILGCNPGTMTLQGTNTYLIGQGKKRILLDASDSDKPDYIKLLASELKKEGCALQEILVSHWHHDHTGGVQDIFKGITHAPIRVSKHRLVEDEEFDQITDYNYVSDNHVFETEGATLQAIFTPGHSKDHLAFILKEENALFSGDCILGETTAQFEDLYTYMQSLQKILNLRPDIIYPGHGPVVKDACTGIRHYIDHRNMRNAQILESLGKHQKPMSIEDLVRDIYVGLAENLIPAASFNVSNHLSALLKENKVVEDDEGGWTLRKSKSQL